MEPKAFINEYGDTITAVTAGTGLLSSVVIAQAALETGWGSSVKKAANNMFGIKATNAWTGKVISLNTSEYINGFKQSISGTGKKYDSYTLALADGANRYTIFRAYDSIKASIKDHNKLITSSSRYKPVLAERTPEGQAKALQDCGYSTSPNYASSLIKIISQYNLTEFDKKKILNYKRYLYIAGGCVVAGLIAWYFIKKYKK